MKKIEENKIAALILIVTLITVFSSCRKEDSYSGEPGSPPKPAQITFQKTYGGVNSEEAWDVRQTNDSGYIIIGKTNSYGAGDYDIYMVKTNASGNILWTKTFGGTEDDEGYYIKQTTDGGYILGGWGGSFGTYNLIKTDANGNVQWSKVYDGLGGDDVQQTSDGGYIVAGPAAGFAGIQLIKTDGNGNITWSKTYSGGNGGAVRQTTDGGYAVVGFGGTFGVGGKDILFLKTDSGGNLVWAKTYGGAMGTDVPTSMQQTANGGYIISGWTTSFGAGAFLIKADASGNLVWSKTYGGNFVEGTLLAGTEQTNDGGYILSGITGSFGNGYALVIKTDNTGKVIWSKIYGAGTEGYSHVHQTSDQGYIILSTTSSFGAGNRDIYLIKTDSEGNSGCHESSIFPTVTTPATLVTSPAPVVYSGGTAFIPSFKIGNGGTETTICYK